MPRARASKSMHFPGSICASSRRGRPASAASISRARTFASRTAIAPNYLSTEKDVADVVHGGRLLQAIARTRAIRVLIREPIAPDLAAHEAEPISSPIFARAPALSTTRSAPAAWAAAPGESVVDAALARAWYRTLARRRCLGISDGDLGQHQCTHAHGGAKSRRSDRDGVES